VLSQSTAETVEEKRNDDNVLVEKLLHELHLDTVSVSEANRLGKRTDTADAKPCPTKLELASEKQKFDVLKQANHPKEQGRSAFPPSRLNHETTK